MADSVKAQLGARHPVLPEMGPLRMAKVDLGKTEMDGRALIGRAIERTRELSGLSLKEFAAAMGKDERQVGKWMPGIERPQLDAIWAVPRFRGLLIQALAELAGDIKVTTLLEIQRIA